eukprot:scaffold30826_cov66-Skeletonema_marinoi.AAC.1
MKELNMLECRQLEGSSITEQARESDELIHKVHFQTPQTDICFPAFPQLITCPWITTAALCAVASARGTSFGT